MMESEVSMPKSTAQYMYANLNWKDLSVIRKKEKFILLFPIGSTESHGPHCPIATDTIIALESCVKGAKELHRRGYDAYVLPPLVYTVAECARNFPGTISISEKTQSALIIEICSQLIKHGMNKICIVNNHGEPGNIRAIYDAIEEVYRSTGVNLLFPNRLRKKFASRMPESFRKGSTHADQYETSLIMAIDKSLVNEKRRRNLKELPISLVTKIFKDHINEFKEMGMDQCYCGDPASASIEEGKQTLDILSGIIVDSVEEMFQGKIPDIDRGLFGQKIPKKKGLNVSSVKKFDYHQPNSLKEAYQIMDSFNGQVHYVAGGTDLFVRIHQKKIEPDILISLKGVKGLSGISFNDSLTLGSMTLLRDIERNAQIRRAYPALFQAVWWLASPQIRNVATVGGNLANSSPSADCAPPLMVLGAMLTIEGPNSKREIPIEDFFTGPGENCMNRTEILTQIKLPVIPPKTGMSFLKIGRVVRDLSISNVSVMLVMEKNTCKNIRLAAGAVAPMPIRLRPVEEMMKGEKITPKLLEQIKKKTEQEVCPISDVRSSAEYRREVTGVLVQRALKIAMQNIP